MGPHDGRYKLFFSYRRMMEDLVRGFLREGWLHGLDLETLEPVSTNLVDRRYRQKHIDCLWRASFEGADGATTDFYLLVEFQSKPDRYMPLRLAGYEILLLEQLIDRRRIAESELCHPSSPWWSRAAGGAGTSPWSCGSFSSRYRRRPRACCRACPIS